MARHLRQFPCSKAVRASPLLQVALESWRHLNHQTWSLQVEAIWSLQVVVIWSLQVVVTWSLQVEEINEKTARVTAIC